ncbi:MAG: valine--tRNA ligase [Gammaproteobacteria bacterium]|nr:valine--tRNA ligase [Gammaproteobacteria bacterium]
MDKTYDPRALESAIYAAWESAGWFSPSGTGSPYCIMIPPPNVTGSLHMGHAFQDTIMDALIRYHRMVGDNTLWQAGTDHAGIATQMVVERQLGAEGVTRHDLGREAFIERVWEWKRQSGGTITRQLRRMGASLDWSRERFTMDDGLSAAVQEVFVRLYDEGLIYRGKRLVNWDPVLHTALSDLEVITEEQNGHLWHLRYPVVGDAGTCLIVATTRPETMLGDTAVAVHPGDERYAHLVGRRVRLPLVDREIPIIADEYVDPEFGSGCVKITPAHDFNDYEVGLRHQLPLINVFTVDAAVDLPGSPYHGLDRYAARERIVMDLKQQDLVAEIEDHQLMVPKGDRSHVVVEPFLTDQWYVKAAPLAAPAIEAVERGDIRFVPAHWSRTYFEWMHNIQDWCISRQIWWGHRIPAWYDEDGNVFVARSEPEARAKAHRRHGHEVALRRDPDVLDTWFSSALWPFSTLGWPKQTDELATFYPTSVLVTGFDIIFFWVARMIMMGLKFTGQVPFREVYIHGLVRDHDGQKMSKSKGNILDPLDLIDGVDLEALIKKRTSGLMQPHLAPNIERATKRQFPDGIPAYGTDALRFTFASLATQGRDIRFDLGRIEGSRNFCNKLWNAARYVLMNTTAEDCGQNGGALALSLPDRWILARLHQVQDQVGSALSEYRLDRLAQVLYGFVWDEYCSWYLELSKVVLNDTFAQADQRRGTRHTLVHVLEAILRLLHPIMPFITEAVWRETAPLAGKTGATIMREPYLTTPEETQSDHAALAEMAWVQGVITGVRNIRGENNIQPSKKLPIILQDMSEVDDEYLDRNRAYLVKFGRLASVTADGEPVPQAATALVGRMKVLVPMGAFIDKSKEVDRLSRDLEKVEKDRDRVLAKLDNPSFVDKAPAAIVAKERERLIELEARLEKLNKQLDMVRGLSD